MIKDVMPVFFISHGAPLLVTEKQKRAQFAAWAGEIPRPKAVLVISAHWYTRHLILGEPDPPSLIYDYFGFPEELYSLKYEAPLAQNLLGEVEALLSDHFEFSRKNRGWDHGVFIPLLCLYPEADIPVLQLSLPRIEEEKYVELGRLLAPLRQKGVLIIGSGSVTHNLHKVDFSDTQEPPDWAVEFDNWTANTLLQRDLGSLIEFRKRAPMWKMNHPTDEHFLPLLVAAGVASGDPVRFPIQGFEYGSISRRCVQWG